MKYLKIFAIFVILCGDGIYSDSNSIQHACGYMSDNGSCGDDFTIKYFYHPEHGRCSRFWYGGCGGNRNRFETEAECIDTCVSPTGRAICDLPKVKGPCTESHLKFYYDSDKRQCNQFQYGGCAGNANRFDSIAECRRLCERSDDREITRDAVPSHLDIPPDCKDNANFANCPEVIRRGACHNRYYSKFCCRSCTLARLV